MVHAVKSLAVRSSAALISLYIGIGSVEAQIFGPVPDLGGQVGDIRVAILNVVKKILTFMALIAVVMIVIAGIRLVISQGEEGEKDKAKKTIIYTIVGLILILLATAIVTFITDTISGR